MYDDEHAGHGGSYLLDPKTGKRELVERTGMQITRTKKTKPAPAPEPEHQGE